jgi:hypothetical protein
MWHKKSPCVNATRKGGEVATMGRELKGAVGEWLAPGSPMEPPHGTGLGTMISHGIWCKEACLLIKSVSMVSLIARLA